MEKDSYYKIKYTSIEDRRKILHALQERFVTFAKELSERDPGSVSAIVSISNHIRSCFEALEEPANSDISLEQVDNFLELLHSTLPLTKEQIESILEYTQTPEMKSNNNNQ